jgi:hypothetical protein
MVNKMKCCVIVAVVGLTACGGGGSDGAIAANAPKQTSVATSTSGLAATTTSAPATTSTAAPTTTTSTVPTTVAPTSSAPPTTKVLTAEEQFLAKAWAVAPEYMTTWAPSAKYEADFIARYRDELCTEARDGMMWGADMVTGEVVLAQVYEILAEHDTGRVAKIGIETFCPDVPAYAAVLAGAGTEKGPQEWFSGTYTVSDEISEETIQPGTYFVTEPENCYWERLDSKGETIANNFIIAAPRAEVTIKASDYAFTSEGSCGGWRRI